jgi:hypothetical protein
MRKLFEYRYHSLTLLVLFVGLFLVFPYVPWWKLMVHLFLLLGLWLLYSEPKMRKYIDSRHFWFWFFFLFGFLFLSRVYPFFLNDVPLGYDTGIYKMQFAFSQQALPEYVSSIFLGLPLITDVQYLFGFSLDSLLAGWYVFWSLFLGFSVYVFAAETWGRRRAMGVLFLFVVSVTQWQAFQFMLYKNIISLSLLLISFVFIQRRSFLILPVIFFLALLQPPDLLFLLLALVVYFFLGFRDVLDRNYLLKLLGVGMVGGVVLILRDAHVWQQGLNLILDFFNGAEDINVAQKTGLFMSLREYLTGSLVFFSCSLIAVISLWSHRKSRILVSAYLVIVMIVFGQLLFHDRYLIEFDLVLLLLTGSLVLPLKDLLWKEYLGRVVVVLVGLSLVYGVIGHVRDEGSWLSSAEISRIESYCSSIPSEAYLMATDSVYAPWVAGFSCHRTIAPGMFEWNLWDYDEWKEFWRMSDLDRISELMSRYDGSDVYLYIGEKQPQLVLDEVLFEKVGDRLWRWEGS